MKTLWCKNLENPSNRISHAWAPLNAILCTVDGLANTKIKSLIQSAFSEASCGACIIPNFYVLFKQPYNSTIES